MRKIFILLFIGVIAIWVAGCKKAPEKAKETAAKAQAKQAFKWQVDQFADIRILRYQVPGFEELSPRQKELIYYLSEAALWGRDIIFDQNYKHNLKVRKTLDAIVEGYQGDRTTPDWEKFMVYA
ncbi:MAG: dihydrofolate reductase, partial [Candidatus Aminicenantes bacterium]|nr:dihydrofolate reductase [Candidatus Aminicenantes bacterium]